MNRYGRRLYDIEESYHEVGGMIHDIASEADEYPVVYCLRTFRTWRNYSHWQWDWNDDDGLSNIWQSDLPSEWALAVVPTGHPNEFKGSEWFSFCRMLGLRVVRRTL